MADNIVELIWLRPLPKEWSYLDLSNILWNNIDTSSLTWDDFERGGYNG